MGKNALELEIYVEKCGIPPLDAISSATKVGAEALGLSEKLGTIERGKLADIILVDGNPINDIKILQKKEKIKTVLKNGKVVKKI
jgi:imidazolonepropionase-like amidohydrolase